MFNPWLIWLQSSAQLFNDAQRAQKVWRDLITEQYGVFFRTHRQIQKLTHF